MPTFCTEEQDNWHCENSVDAKLYFVVGEGCLKTWGVVMRQFGTILRRSTKEGEKIKK
jgi:hypothetical protein